MLLNISNHPYMQWSEEQRTEAQYQYGPVHDLPFPEIDPELGSAGVEKLARDFARQAAALLQQTSDSTGEHSKNAVHVMGEFTFSFALVSLLQQQNIRCVASTTRRMVELAGGQKISHFRFCRFREYPQQTAT